MYDLGKYIELGDYVLVRIAWHYDIRYFMYHHSNLNKDLGKCWFSDDLLLSMISTDDTDLITILLLRYNTSRGFRILPYWYE